MTKSAIDRLFDDAVPGDPALLARLADAEVKRRAAAMASAETTSAPETQQAVATEAPSPKTEPKRHASRPTPLHAALNVVSGASIRPQAVHWLWPDYLPLGKLTILGGAPGIGKTSVALSAAATTTVERSAWPDGSVNLAARDVLLWSAEDGIEDTLVPKLLAAGADMERVHFVRGVFDHHGHRAFDPSTDMDMLVEAAAAIPELGLILVEPLVLAVSGNSDRNGDVRRGLAPLAEMAERLGVVVLGITHFSKGTSGRDPVERVTGSIAFGAAARLVLVGVRRADEGDFALLRAKSNVGPTDGGFSYRLERVPVPGFDGLAANAVTWTGAIAGIARDILSDAEGDLDSMRGEKLGDAVMFLRDLLVDGPQTYQQVMSDARAAGYSEATIKRARSKLGVVAEKGEGPRAGWRLALPKQDHTMGLSS